MSGFNGIKVETGQDKVVNTIPALRVNMNKVEMASDQTAPKSRIEIPERKKPTENADSDSGEDFKFLENGKKSKIVQISEKDNNLDSKSERSKRSVRSKNSQSFPNSQDNYTPRKNNCHVDTKRTKDAEDQLPLPKHNKGFKYSNRKYTIDDDVDEIRDAVENVTRKKRTEEGIVFYTDMTMILVACITMFNSAFNPMDIDLEAWKTNINYDLKIGKYDDPFEALVDKYSGTSTFAPELRILGMMGTNLVMTVMAQYANKQKLAEIALEREKIKREMKEEIYRENAALYAANRGTQGQPRE
ncbi:hypothetical protein BDK51DRAFT_26861 [Blyttiomyces helicus]|uniref:Uncharacterized protein n=1 Tax=Blyttiomyces helicus TaxID=388810 RepID=A0A4P9WTZ2_9FUNG|nr:hypothetical protein BDK51DRAFT_26861 [Blyttiomyces helicus]|eukprot:RKO94576.1 hypothetical protein BDK51DRAFT_26861 [Blyttiomyces helicus]